MMRSVLRIPVLAAAAVLAPAAIATASPNRGVVVDWNRSTHTATIVDTSGHLVAVQTASAPRAGSAVSVIGARAVRPGTVSGRLKRVGLARHARVTAMVVAHSGSNAVALAGPGTTLLVRLGSSGKVKRSKEVAQPAVGSTVTADLVVDRQGNLEADDVTEVRAPQPNALMEIEGKITAVDPAARTITLVESEHGLTASFTVNIPTTEDITKFTVGNAAEVKVTKAADGTLTLSTIDDQDEGDDQDGDHHSGGGGDEHTAPSSTTPSSTTPSTDQSGSSDKSGPSGGSGKGGSGKGGHSGSDD